jgi:hypothetical protein
MPNRLVRRLAMSNWLVCGYALALLLFGIVVSVKFFVPYL